MYYSYNEIVRAARTYEMKVNARNVGAIAVLDTGAYGHNDLYRRIIDYKDIVSGRSSLYDDNGHGTHICGIIAGNGRASRGRILGISAKCPLVVIKVLEKNGNGKVDNVLKGCEYVIKNKDKLNIRIVNISMGAEVVNGDEEMKRLLEGVEALWENGIVVMVSGGNNGPKPMSITAPGNSKKVITVGACDDDAKGIVKNKYYSGRGPTIDCVVKPDIVTVGSNILSIHNTPNGYMRRSGTSMATAVASAVVGVFMEKDYSYTPKEVKKLLIDSAVDMGKDIKVQGNGMLNIERLFNL